MESSRIGAPPAAFSPSDGESNKQSTKFVKIQKFSIDFPLTVNRLVKCRRLFEYCVGPGGLVQPNRFCRIAAIEIQVLFLCVVFKRN